MPDAKRQRLAAMPPSEQFRWLEALSSCAIENNKPAAQCSDLLNRHIGGERLNDNEIEVLMQFIGDKDA